MKTFVCKQCGETKDMRERALCDEHICLSCDEENAFRFLVKLLNQQIYLDHQNNQEKAFTE